MITLDEAKLFLRVDSDEEDGLITDLLAAAGQLCRDTLRLEELPDTEATKAAVMYATAYLYEHREDGEHKDMLLTLRALLFGDREAAF